MLSNRRTSSLGGELKRLRKAAGLTQKQVAEMAEWSVSKVIRIENGEVKVTKASLIHLSHIYGIRGTAKESELHELWANLYPPRTRRK